MQTYKEVYEQECKERENAHHIKEEEIQKIRTEQEVLKADYHENIQLLRENYQDQINVYDQKVSLCIICTPS